MESFHFVILQKFYQFFIFHISVPRIRFNGEKLIDLVKKWEELLSDIFQGPAISYMNQSQILKHVNQLQDDMLFHLLAVSYRNFTR